MIYRLEQEILVIDGWRKIVNSIARIVVPLLIALAVPPPLLGQEMIWVTVDGKAPVVAGDTERAKIQALEDAEKRAVAKALASEISVETLLVNMKLSGSIAGAIPFGRVAEKKILQENQKAAGGASGSREMVHHVRLKAGVVHEIEGGADPTFRLNASINRSVFKDGDQLEIYIRTTKKCYIAVFNILEDKKIIQLLPNSLVRKKLLPADEKFSFPCTEDRKMGLDLIVHLPKDRTSVTESIYVLALPQPVNFASINVQEGIFGVYNGQTAFMEDLIREVVTIPLKNRAEALMQYRIRKPNKGI